MTDADIAAISCRQLADYEAHRPGRVFEDPAFRLTLDEAYGVQLQTAALRVARGEAIGGYKIGCTSEPVQRQLHVNQPVFGHLFTTEFHPSGVTLNPAAYDHLAIEGELAIRMGDGVADFASAFVVIELHNHIFRASRQTAQELIANNAFHAGIVLPVELNEHAEFGVPSETGPLAVYRNGKLLGRAPASVFAGGPGESARRIADHVAGCGGRILKGQVLLTGSPLPLYPVEPGDEIVVQCPCAGEVRVRISDSAIWPQK